jgi:hypothetical protein
MLYQSTCVGFGYGPVAGAVSWNAKESRDNPLSPDNHPASVTSSGPRNIDLVPIGYGFRPRLRGRLTLRGLTLRRNPWTFGDRVSHPVGRYSCQHSHFRYLHRPSQVRLRRPTERSATKQLAVVSGQWSDLARSAFSLRSRPCNMRAISSKAACQAPDVRASAKPRSRA